MKCCFKVSGVLSIWENRTGAVVHPSDKQRVKRQGGLRLVHRGSNMVVNDGLDAIRCLIGGCLGAPLIGAVPVATMDDCFIDQMRLANPAAPVSPDPLQDAADPNVISSGAPIWTWDVTFPTAGDALLATTYPALGEVLFTGLVPAISLNGLTANISEETLWTRSGTLFARTTFDQPKSGAFALQFEHLLSFNRV